MNLVAISRREIELADMSAGDPCVAICIAYPTGRLHKIHPVGALRAVLHLRFSDCDEHGGWSFPENKDMENVPMPMTRGQAVDVLDFIEKWRGEISTICAACYGGVSRSRGILAGLAAAYGWDDTDLYAKGQPNAWCKTLIVREARIRAALGGRGE
jgi:predicted protein tyrosine phosphatase